MVVQFLIDWDDILSSIDLSKDTLECALFAHLARLIQKNGCLINSHYTESTLVKWLNQKKLSVGWNGVLSSYYDLYHDCGLRVDSEHIANSILETITQWKTYLDASGIDFSANAEDGRCILLSKAGGGGGVFYANISLHKYIDNEDNLSSRWCRLQHFSETGVGVKDFLAYLEAFAATAKEYIRIYDPYLSLAFLPLNGPYAKDAILWRNSFQFLMSLFFKNSHVETFDIVTSVHPEKITKYLHGALPGVNRLRIQEVLSNFLVRNVTRRSRPANIALHFLEKNSGDDFHDRFLVNGRFCFAIGHGCDICCGYKNSKPQLTSSFNVFYGCSSKDVPSGLSVFSHKPDKYPLDIYPQGSSARPFGNIKEWFDMGGNNETISVKIGNNASTVLVNPPSHSALTCSAVVV